MKQIAQFTISIILVACPILGHATTYTYDALNRLTSATYSNGDFVKYSYDAGGNIIRIQSSARNGHEEQDSDRDGLTDLQETQYHTNPLKVDTDGDGIPDKWEIITGSVPTKADALADSDNNGYTNLQEYRAAVNPRLDTDHDGMFDGDEIKYKTNPRNSSDCPTWYCQGFKRK